MFRRRLNSFKPLLFSSCLLLVPFRLLRQPVCNPEWNWRDQNYCQVLASWKNGLIYTRDGSWWRHPWSSHCNFRSPKTLDWSVETLVNFAFILIKPEYYNSPRLFSLFFIVHIPHSSAAQISTSFPIGCFLNLRTNSTKHRTKATFAARNSKMTLNKNVVLI